MSKSDSAPKSSKFPRNELLHARIQASFASGLGQAEAKRASLGGTLELGEWPNERPPLRAHLGEHGSGADPCSTDRRHCARRGHTGDTVRSNGGIRPAGSTAPACGYG